MYALGESRSMTKLFIPDWDVMCDPNESFPTYMLAEHRNGITSLVKANTENAFMNQAPRYFIETLGIVIVAVLVIVMNYKWNYIIFEFILS